MSEPVGSSSQDQRPKGVPFKVSCSLWTLLLNAQNVVKSNVTACKIVLFQVPRAQRGRCQNNPLPTLFISFGLFSFLAILPVCVPQATPEQVPCRLRSPDHKAAHPPSLLARRVPCPTFSCPTTMAHHSARRSMRDSCACISRCLMNR